MLKGGDKAISTIIQRSGKGLEFRVHLHEAVEEFMRGTSGEETNPVALYGRKFWTPDNLEVYDIPESMRGTTMVNNSTSYRLDRPGHEMFATDPSTGIRVVNMSFIRLKGASGPDGVTFVIPGAFDKQDVIWLAGAITEAGSIICQKYIYPMIISTSNVIRAEVPNGLQ